MGWNDISGQCVEGDIGENVGEGHISVTIGQALKLLESRRFPGEFTLIADLEVQFAVECCGIGHVHDAELNVDAAVCIERERCLREGNDGLPQRRNGERGEGKDEGGLGRRLHGLLRLLQFGLYRRELFLQFLGGGLGLQRADLVGQLLERSKKLLRVVSLRLLGGCDLAFQPVDICLTERGGGGRRQTLHTLIGNPYGGGREYDNDQDPPDPFRFVIAPVLETDGS